jgi:hypothetical protein
MDRSSVIPKIRTNRCRRQVLSPRRGILLHEGDRKSHFEKRRQSNGLERCPEVRTRRLIEGIVIGSTVVSRIKPGRGFGCAFPTGQASGAPVTRDPLCPPAAKPLGAAYSRCGATISLELQAKPASRVSALKKCLDKTRPACSLFVHVTHDLLRSAKCPVPSKRFRPPPLAADRSERDMRSRVGRRRRK